MRLNKIIAKNLCLNQRKCCQSFVYYSTTGFRDKPDVAVVKSDVIGPPDKESNLRPILRHQSLDETPLQNRLRLRQLEVEAWNQEFWKNHNERFYKERDEFIKLWQAKPEDTLTADEMSVFYKKFLDTNWRLHFLYNISWYTKNVELLVLATRVNIQILFKNMRKPKN